MMEEINQHSNSHIQVYENMLKSFSRDKEDENRSHFVAKASQPRAQYIAQAGFKLVNILSSLSPLHAGISGTTTFSHFLRYFDNDYNSEIF